MKISTRARYALRMILDIGLHSKKGSPVKLENVAERTDISRRYLDQIVLPLKNAGLIRGIKGPGGGYVLGKSPREISLASILKAEIGPIALVDCVLDEDVCDKNKDCPARLVYRLLSLLIEVTLKDLSLATLMNEKSLKRIESRVDSLSRTLES
ncbi:MAG: Rrf2 family transcriptional regulator [Deltaproteobacteria bacterium]|nr:Rrf2 family transcriptional regulator [Deltaproteobacteria bacterium]